MRPILREILANQLYPCADYAFDFTNGRYRSGRQVGWQSHAPETLAAALGLTFARASVAYAQSMDGAWCSFASGVPRITNRGFLCEPSRTNLLLYCRDLTNAAWTKSSTTAALTQTGILGDANSAALVTATGANGTILQAVTSASAARLTTAFVKRVTGSGTVEFTTDGGTTWTAITSSLSTGAWFRASLSQTVTNPSVGFRLATSGDAIAVDFVQLESATTATSPILTTSASATRAADVMKLTLNGAPPCSVVTDVEPNAILGANVLSWDDATSANRVLVSLNTGPTIGASTIAATVTTASPTVSYAGVGALVCSAARMATDDVQIYSGGVAGTRDTSATMPAGLTTLHIGCRYDDTTQATAYIRRAALYLRALPDAELERLSR